MAQVVFDFEDQQVPAGWVPAGGSIGSWSVTDSAAASGSFSLRSDAITHNQMATIEWTGVFEDSTLSFQLRQQAESCCDYFSLSIDGQVVYSRTGQHLEWTEVRKPIDAGQHTIRWSYSKDGSVSVGADAVWIDDVRVGSALPVSFPLLQQPGALVTSSQDSISETRFDTGSVVQYPVEFEGQIAISPAGQLYLASQYQYQSISRVYRYAPLTNELIPFSPEVSFNSAFAWASDRLIGGQDYSCGAYSLVFLASGNVFMSSNPSPCQAEWNAAVVAGSNLYVLHNYSISRRNLTAPSAVVSSFNLPDPNGYYASDVALAADGTLWVARAYKLLHLAADWTVLGEYDVDYAIQKVAAREDGLLAVSTGSISGFLQPQHGFKRWGDYSAWQSDIAFLPGVVVDEDADQLPLWWEQAYSLDPTSAADATTDPDGDGLNNLEEYEFRSNPTLADSDSDGASDALEFAAGSNPQDSDSDDDGLSDGIEIVDLGSDPLSPDTDGDGMGDYYEFTHGLDVTQDDSGMDLDGDGLSNLAEFQGGTHPAVFDTDSDGLSDGAEVLIHATDPLDPDTDGDGLSDGIEVNTYGTDPTDGDSDGDSLSDHLEVVVLGSDPNHPDTDRDGMPDDWEYLYSLNLLVDDTADDVDQDGLSNVEEFLAGTSPTNPDSDHDELSDGEEINLGTDPRLRDTDGDRLPDGWEFGFAYNPLAADSDLDNDGDSFTALEEYWSDSAENDPESFPRPQVWGTHQGGPRHNGFQPLSIRPRPNQAPVLSLTVDAPVQPLATGGGRIYYTVSSYFGTTSRLVAVDVASGQEAWRQNFGQVYSVNPPAYSDGRVYVQSVNNSGGTFLNAFDAGSGELLFRTPHGAQWERYLAPTVFAGHVYVNGGTYGGAYAFDRVSGMQQWFAPLAQVDEWTPAVDSNHVYAYTAGYLDVLDRATGMPVWRIRDPLQTWSSWTVGMAPVLGGFDNVIICSQGHMTSFDALDRSVGWTFAACDNNQPTVANGLVYAIASGALVALDEISGALVWTKGFTTQLSGNVLATRDFVIVSDQVRTHLVRISDRSIAQSFPAKGDKVLTAEGLLIISDDAGGNQDTITAYQLDLTNVANSIFYDSFE